MRKGIVIAVFGILLAGGLVYVLVDWGPDTVEHHTKGYLAQCYWNGFEKWVDKWAPQFAGRLLHEWKGKRKLQHLEALVRLGTLRHERIPVYNASPSEVGLKVMIDNPNVPVPQSRDLFEEIIYSAQPNVIHLYAKPDDAKVWTNLIRKADVPAAKLRL